jgi:hypothetical protein
VCKSCPDYQSFHHFKYVQFHCGKTLKILFLLFWNTQYMVVSDRPQMELDNCVQWNKSSTKPFSFFKSSFSSVPRCWPVKTRSRVHAVCALQWRKRRNGNYTYCGLQWVYSHCSEETYPCSPYVSIHQSVHLKVCEAFHMQWTEAALPTWDTAC